MSGESRSHFDEYLANFVANKTTRVQEMTTPVPMFRMFDMFNNAGFLAKHKEKLAYGIPDELKQRCEPYVRLGHFILTGQLEQGQMIPEVPAVQG